MCIWFRLRASAGSNSWIKWRECCEKIYSCFVFSYLQYFEHRRAFDPFLTQPGIAADPFQSHPNPWISDTVDFWQHDKMFVQVAVFIKTVWKSGYFKRHHRYGHFHSRAYSFNLPESLKIWISNKFCWFYIINWSCFVSESKWTR